MSSLINKTHVRNYTLAALAEKRPALKDKMTRISDEYFIKVDAATRRFVSSYLETMPSSGKTIK